MSCAVLAVFAGPTHPTLYMFVSGPMRTSNGATLQGDRVLTIPTSVMDVRLKKTQRESGGGLGGDTVVGSLGGSLLDLLVLHHAGGGCGG